MPSSRDFFINSLISCTWPLKISSLISGELSRISIATLRPLPSRAGIKRCEITPFRLSDKSISNCWRRSSGKKLMMRSSAWLALLACKVARQRWPVSANAMAWSMVSRSRISPICITSGAWRKVFFRAVAQSSVSTPTSRWVTMQLPCRWMNSTGSSMVMMWPWLCALRWPTMAAMVVDLPEPVAPTMMTRPRLLMMTSARMGGRSRSSSLGMVVVMVRSTMPTQLIWTNAETRKRPRSPGLMAKLASLLSSKPAVCLSFMMDRARSAVWAAVRGWLDTGVILPSILMAGGKPAVMKRSEPPLLVIKRSRSNMNFEAWRVSKVLSREIVRRLGGGAGGARRDDVAAHQVGQVLVQGLHADVAARLDRRVHLGNLGFADQVADGGRADHDFVGGHPAAAVLGFEQGLRDDGLQGLGQHGAHHFLFIGGEDVDDAVDGLGSRGGVQGAEHQVARFRGRQGQADGFQVAQFADQDAVGVFAQGRAQGIVEGERVRSHFALVDQAFLGIVHEFDGVFDRQDVAVLVFIEVGDHRRERRRFARAGGARHQHEAAGPHG